MGRSLDHKPDGLGRQPTGIDWWAVLANRNVLVGLAMAIVFLWASCS
jgi:hypothetical protein